MGRIARVEPAEYIKAEMKERGWDDKALASASGLKISKIRGLLNQKPHKHDITYDVAIALANAFGTSAGLWISLQNECARKKLVLPFDLPNTSEKMNLFLQYLTLAAVILGLDDKGRYYGFSDLLCARTTTSSDVAAISDLDYEQAKMLYSIVEFKMNRMGERERRPVEALWNMMNSLL